MYLNEIICWVTFSLATIREFGFLKKKPVTFWKFCANRDDVQGYAAKTVFEVSFSYRDQFFSPKAIVVEPDPVFAESDSDRGPWFFMKKS